MTSNEEIGYEPQDLAASLRVIASTVLDDWHVTIIANNGERVDGFEDPFTLSFSVPRVDAPDMGWTTLVVLDQIGKSLYTWLDSLRDPDYRAPGD